MKVTIEVKDKAADLFRAFRVAKSRRRPNMQEHIKRAQDGLPPFKRTDRVEYDVEQVAFAGDIVAGESSFVFETGKITVTRVVLYFGPGEMVVGSAEVNAAGKIKVDIVEPAALD